MTGRHRVRVTVLEITRDQYEGEPFSTLVAIINDAWREIPPEYQAAACFEFQYSGLLVWYDRPETEDDRRERLEFERLKEKFEKERPFE